MKSTLAMWIVFIIALVEFLAFIYINYTSYAMIMDVSVFCTIFMFQMVFGIYSLLAKTNKPFLTIQFALILVMPVLFWVATPNVSYADGRKHIQDVDEQILQRSFIDAGKRTIVVEGIESWVLSDRKYVYQFTEENQDYFYLVHPNEGNVEQLQQPPSWYSK
ncbi:hypothetical protein [Pontibacillus salicampi]